MKSEPLQKAARRKAVGLCLFRLTRLAAVVEGQFYVFPKGGAEAGGRSFAEHLKLYKFASEALNVFCPGPKVRALMTYSLSSFRRGVDSDFGLVSCMAFDITIGLIMT